MTNKQKNKIDKILSEYFDVQHSDKVSKAVRYWLVSEKNEAEKIDALWKLFDQRVIEDVNPGAWTDEMYEDLKMRLAAKQTHDSGNTKVIKRRTPFHRSIPFLRYAAVLIPAMLLVGATFGLLHIRHGVSDPAPLAAFVTMAVPDTLGAQHRTLLPDGSNILVRPGSDIAWAGEFNMADTRHVKLSGQAYFDVAKDSTRQFIVETEHIKVHVLGTSFDVQNDPTAEQTVISLYRGQVRAEVSDGTTLTLTPGQRLVYENSTGRNRIEPIAGNLPEWVAERLSFKDATLDKMLHVMEWYLGVQFEVTGRIDPAKVYTFRIDGTEDLDTALRLLEELVPGMKCTAYGNTVGVNVERVSKN